MQNHEDDKVITNDDILGDAVPYDQQDFLRSICFRLLELVPSVSLQRVVGYFAILLLSHIVFPFLITNILICSTV